MIIPVRCFTCGSLVGSKWEPFQDRIKAGEDPREVLHDIGVERYCCRRMLMAHVELIDEVGKYII